jgi:CDP-glucose 4,6-dehydratase
MGAIVQGYALAPPSTPNLFELGGVAQDFERDVRGDLRDASKVAAALAESRPDVVLHLAAHSLVRPSYADPLGAFATNVLGTAHVLEAARACPSVRSVVVVTTDKCYENREWLYPYRETDALGGHDPYSASKACAELVAACWRSSFFNKPGTVAHVATARAGNVIGAGDWAVDRLVPDCFRAFARGEPIRLRHPDAVRPWQHVLEPLSGYLVLAEDLFRHGERVAEGWNFGPDQRSDASVADVARTVARLWGDGARVEIEAAVPAVREAGLLRLDSTRARVRLGWTPRWSLERALTETVRGYKTYAAGMDLRALVVQQIDAYCTSDVEI